MENILQDNTEVDDLVLSSNSDSDTEPSMYNTNAPNSSNAFVDKITLELLLNKTNYQKYLSKSEPQKFAEYQEFLDNCNKHKRQIINITCGLINNPANNNKCSTEVANAFETYAKILIRYLEMKEMTESIQAANNQEYNVRDLDEDVLFPAIMDEQDNSVSDFYSDDDLDQDQMNASIAPTSFFVPPAPNNRTNSQITQTFTMDRFFMRGPLNKSNKK